MLSLLKKLKVNNNFLTVSINENGKDLDVEAMSRVCKGCTLNEELRIKDPEAYNIWRSAHVCNLNTVKNTYADIEVKKLECVGHVQKRVGCRL